MARASVGADASIVLEVFKKFDQGNDGYITQVELGDVIRRIQPPGGTGLIWNDRQIQTLLEAIDTNNDGKIQYQEFVAWVFGEPVPPEGAKAGQEEVRSSPKGGQGKPAPLGSPKGGASRQTSLDKSKAQPSPKSGSGKKGKKAKSGESLDKTKSGEGLGKPETPKKASKANKASKASKEKAEKAQKEEDEDEDEEDEEDEDEEEEEEEEDEDEEDDEEEEEEDAEEDEDEDEDEAEEEDDAEEEDEESDSDSGDEKRAERRRVVNAGRNLVWQKLMPSEEGTARAAADVMKDLPPPDEKNPDDHRHAELYIKNHTDDRDLDGKPPPGAKRKPTLRWLHAALQKIGGGDHGYMLPAKYLLGNWRLWPDCQNGQEQEFVKLKSFAEKKLDVIGVKFEQDVYVELKIGEKLGSVGQDVPPARPRQDEGLPLPKNFKGVADEEEAWDHFYMALLLTAVHAIDPLYQEEARRICEAAGGEWKGPAPKGYMRMFAKLETDHKEAKVPRAAENIDTNRAAWTFEQPEDLRKAFEGAAAAWGQPLRVKNGYNPGFKALEISKGYRNILANYRFAPEGLTWGKLIDREDGQTVKAWDRLRQKMLESFLKYGYADEKSLDAEWKQYLRYFDHAREHISSEKMREKPVVLVVEVQYMLRQYMAMRKKTHAWYKIVRADNAEAMVWDYMWN